MYEALAKAKTITEVYQVARQLKKAGEDEMAVNSAATKRKKELIAESSSTCKIKKLVPATTPVNGHKISMFPIIIKRLNTGGIQITKSNEIVL